VGRESWDVEVHPRETSSFEFFDHTTYRFCPNREHRKSLKNMVPPTRIERAARGLGNEGQKQHYPRDFNYFKHFSLMRSGQE